MLVSWVLAVVLGFASASALRRVRVAREPSRRALRARRPADRRRHHVGARVDAVHDRDLRRRLSLARPSSGRRRRRARPRPTTEGDLMTVASFLTGSLLTLLLPLALLVGIGIWWAVVASPPRRALGAAALPRERRGRRGRRRRDRRAAALGVLRRDAAAAVGAAVRCTAQATWARGARPAPQFALRDQHGRLVSLARAAGPHGRADVPRLALQGGMPGRGPDARRRDPAGAASTAAAARRRERRSGRRHAATHRARRPEVAPAGRDARGCAGRTAQLARVWRDYQITVDPVSGDIVHSTAST